MIMLFKQGGPRNKGEPRLMATQKVACDAAIESSSIAAITPSLHPSGCPSRRSKSEL